MATAPIDSRRAPTVLGAPFRARRIQRLTSDGISVSPYFNSYAWTSDGEWIFYSRHEGDVCFVEACEIESGCRRRLAGPFRAPTEVMHEDELGWASLNAIPGTRAATFIASGAVWRVDLDDAREPARLGDLPHRFGFYGNTDVSADGRWHTFAACMLSREGWNKRAELAWPPDEFFGKYLDRSIVYRMALDGSGRVEHLFDAPHQWLSHISVSPTDADAILYSDGTNHAFRWGRIFLRRVGETSTRSIRDQRSGNAWVTHEKWFADGKRIAYHGHYEPASEGQPLMSYAGWFDLQRDLPTEFVIEGPRHAYGHVAPSIDGTRLFLDMLPCEKRAPQHLYELILDRANGTCRREPVCDVVSDLSNLPIGQWRSIDPILSPDGKRILFKAAHEGEVHLYVVDL